MLSSLPPTASCFFVLFVLGQQQLQMVEPILPRITDRKPFLFVRPHFIG
jgi:hypothetical protein